MAMQAFQKRILHLIQSHSGHSLSEKEFNDLAVETYQWQRTMNPVYRSFCEVTQTPQRIRRWQDIPALPVSSFKFHPVVCFKKQLAVKVFKTSGTTWGTKRGKHYLDSTVRYDAAIQTLFKQYVLPDVRRIRMASLVPSSRTAPESSLSYMVSQAAKAFGHGKTHQAIAGSKLKGNSLAAFLKKAILNKKPVMILATTFSLASFLDYLAQRKMQLPLPSGSRIMETGGFKGKGRAVSRPVLLKRVKRMLGVDARHVINEYGMTELSSQFYDVSLTQKKSPASSVKGIPPWTRVRIIHPATGKALPKGSRGLIRILDLANLGSISFIQTEDEGRLVGNGFKIVGRRKGADLRGCSLTFEEMESLCR